MGIMVGHVLPGLGFFLIGLWHLFNHIKLHSQHPHSYLAPVWFPTDQYIWRHLELYLIMFGSCTFISTELLVGLARHQQLDPDGTIPTNHLHKFEHTCISLGILVYAIFALVLDRIRPRLEPAVVRMLVLLVAASALAQELLLFHFHSADHMGVEGQFHALFQCVVAVSLATTLAGIGYPRSFAVSFVRSAGIMFQGVWLIVMGIMLWTPPLVSKGCFLKEEDERLIVRCDGQGSLDRAKSLVNLQFSWYLTSMAIFSVIFYLYLNKKYPEVPEHGLAVAEMKDTTGGGGSNEEGGYYLESAEELEETHSFINIGKGLKPLDLQR